MTKAGRIPFQEMIEADKRDDPEFRAYWKRTAFAREISHAVLRYRIAHDLSIERLAARLDVASEVVGLLEDGEDDPDIGTLRLLSERLGLRFMLDIHPVEPSGGEVTYSIA